MYNCTLYSVVWGTMHLVYNNVYCALHRLGALCTIHCTLYTVQCTVYSVQYTVVHCTTVQYTVIHCTNYCINDKRRTCDDNDTMRMMNNICCVWG